MNLLLKIINNPKEAIATGSHEFKKERGNIGRESDCSWVLADKQGVVSRVHLEVEYRSGTYFMLDMSTNGTMYKKENKKVAPKELVPFVEGDVLSIGPYDILVGFVKSNSQGHSIDDFLNKREIDIAVEEKLLMKRKGNSPLDIILKDKVEDKDILEFANIKPKENIFLDDAFDNVDAVLATNAYTTHIDPPTFENEIAEEKEVAIIKSETLLQTIFASKLGISLSNLKEEQQIALVSELADSILIAIEGIEQLTNNIESIEKKLEKPNLKLELKKFKNSKVLLKERLYGKEQKLSASLAKSFEDISQSHTALYEASKAQSEEIEHEFAPNTLAQEFKISNPIMALFGQEKKNWNAYLTKYQYLNEITASKGFQARLFKKYQRVMETFNLASTHHS
ncbi:MAG TPA: FHA domain-containing protein [Campylobacterales bacterium]|nr:FHA domain-containing protein [Campylobacterales bacterium]